MHASRPCRDVPPASLRRFRVSGGLTAVIVTALSLLVAVLLLTELLRSPKPPHVEHEPPVSPALTEHLLLFVVDGLRYDLGVDPDIVPNYARHMRTQTHGRMWADRVTMTSSALLSIGAGQRGDFMQLVLNLNGRDLGYDNIVANARSKGLLTALAGDETWARSFGKFDSQVVDAHGMSIETDNSQEIFEASYSIARAEPRANLFVAHFISTDHQAHAHGTDTPQYAAHLRKFDADMQRFLDVLSDDWTVLVTSDHGQTATGAHGTDTPTMRLCPLFAYGKGIRAGVDLGDIDQVDLGATMSVLLGIPVPAQGKGTPITEMLDVSQDTAAAIACSDASRIERVAKAYGHAEVSASLRDVGAVCKSPGSSAAARLESGRAAVRAYDLFTQSNRSSSGIFGSLLTTLLLLLMLAVPASLHVWSAAPGIPTRAALRFAAVAVAVALLCVGLTYQVERFTPPWHNVVRAVLFIAANAAMLYAAIRPSHAASFYDRRPALALALVPGAFVWSYPANTSAESFVVLLLGAAVWLFAPHRDLRPISHLFRGKPALPWWRIGLVAIALFWLFFYAVFQSDSLPSLVKSPPWLLIGTGLAMVVAWLAAGARQRDEQLSPWELPIAIMVACGIAIGRRFMTSDVGLVSMVAFPILAAAAALRGRFTLAFGLGFASYSLVSRDTEVVALGAGLLLLEAVSHAAAQRDGATKPGGGFRPFSVATLVAMGFAVMFLVRVGLQGGLDLGNIDYGTGGFGDPNVSQLRLGIASVWKYAAADLLLLGVFYRRLPRDLLSPVAVGVTVVLATRLAVLALILYTCRSSYWTAFRSVSDAAPTLVAAPISAMVLLVVGLLSVRPLGQKSEVSTTNEAPERSVASSA